MPVCACAGLELKGLEALVALGVPGLSFPLMCIVDHLGHRMSASSSLPIGRGTLVYGSADAGRTVHGEESLPTPALARALREAARRLNLAPHGARRV